jgi:hypothetical protein
VDGLIGGVGEVVGDDAVACEVTEVTGVLIAPLMRAMEVRPSEEIEIVTSRPARNCRHGSRKATGMKWPFAT